MIEPDEPRALPDTLQALIREDLALLSLDALESRIAVLEQEIGRARTEISTKHRSRSVADALFKFSKD